jgi:diaminopimelate decarboxylase
MPIEGGAARQVLLDSRRCANVVIEGVHCHIGSQIWEIEPYIMAAKVMLAFYAEMLKLSVPLTILNIGGGFPARYLPNDPVVDIAGRIGEIAAALRRECEIHDIDMPYIMLEPGRSIVADAGMTLYRAGAIKHTPDDRRHTIVDGGMGDNIRRALYGAEYTAYNASDMRAPREIITIAGRNCEEGDVVIKDTEIARVNTGDIIAVATTGAYNYSMASNYNRVPRLPIVMVEDGKARVVVRRETWADVARLDV